MKPKSEIMQEMRAARAASGLKRFEIWLPEANGKTAKALKALAEMDADSISALLSDNQCSSCREYCPYNEQKRDVCEDCYAKMYE
jgi:hypothetical protein